ncbi:MAG TPA: cobyric acid synthase, partial [Nitrospiraceae bacterium]|nr:cobyric acid synthase [Nitrospiraceae bacterium]
MEETRSHRLAKAIALLGTGSDVGKSVLSAGLCRLLCRDGRAVAPFKAQNMSLNSSVTPEGGEIGRAQALQAEACGIPPHVDMNPILLKPESETSSQVIVQGRIHSKLQAAAYGQSRAPLFQFVRESYERLARQYEVIVIEGAGSAAEVNLRERDLVNWPVAHLADAGVLLIADIDRGGVFAQVIGTLDLLTPEERRRIIGIVINKFRGDRALFEDGIAFIEQRTGVPVLGVIPFLRPLQLDQEDSLSPDLRGSVSFSPQLVNVAVLLVPHMSNFTDFNPLLNEPDVALRYSSTPAHLVGADVVILPGTKNTLADLRYLKQQGWDGALHAHVQNGGELVGICGGYQMLGGPIGDPYAVEAGGEATGLELLDIATTLQRDKVTTLVEGIALHIDRPSELRVRGYHIHMGETVRHRHEPSFHVTTVSGRYGGSLLEDGLSDGAVREDGLV